MIDPVAAAQVIDIESIDTDENGRETFAWLRLADDRGALWHFDIANSPGEAQSLNVVEGA